MKSILIADTTREEREQIVAESIGNIDGLCDGCSPGLIEMYHAYIDGRKELREINMEFNARYTRGAMGPDREKCDYLEQ
ncbi:MAG: purine biosynthesis protein PurH [Clostridia bacterium]|nr:purine biosynthesis protein PurH [Clostridia bacterium]